MWLSERYPCILHNLTDTSLPSIDNLYLDMNGLIHACTHNNKEDSEVPKTKLPDKEIFLKIFQYIDKLFNLVQPTKYFVMAVDGVAPRAKMNQQRSRRYRSAKDSEDIREVAVKKGLEVPDRKDVFNTSSITPGTEFMTELDSQIHYFIRKKLQEDIRWEKCKVIYSGHLVPGEGEHKIMSFIRGRKAQKDYQKNESHCMYGLDADLIMLALSVHEPHFILLREEVKFNFKSKRNLFTEYFVPKEAKFQIIHVCLIREYLDFEMMSLKDTLPFNYNLERIIDDFVLLCYLCGNDFIPHSPTLEIRDGAIAKMYETYKQIMPNMKGYITENNKIHYDRLEKFLVELSKFEEEMLENKLKKRMKRSKRKGGFEISEHDEDEDEDEDELEIKENVSDKIFKEIKKEENVHELLKEEGLLLKEDIQKGFHEDLQIPELSPNEENKESLKKMDLLVGHVKNGKFDFKNWKKDYYRIKMGINSEDPKEMRKMKKKFIESLAWTFDYYYHGCPSWGWFYPYHYSPLAQDLTDLDDIGKEIQFEIGKPFLPFEQLMSVLSPFSADLVPKAYQTLMLNKDSPIIDFYPKDFDIDKEGTRYDYEGVIILPFIDQDRLQKETKKYQKNLSNEEMKRNTEGKTYEFSFDYNIKSYYPSSLFGILPSIDDCHTKPIEYEFPSDKNFKPELCNDVNLGKKGLEGFPSFQILDDIKIELENININIFGRRSKTPTLTIEIGNKGKITTQDFESLLGKKIYIGYPYPKEGIISSICDEKGSIFNERKESHNQKDKEDFKNEIKIQEGVLKKKYGIILKNTQVLIYVHLFKEMKKNNQGKIVKDYTEEEYSFPSQLLLFDYYPIKDPKFSYKNHSENFPIHSQVVSLEEKYFGYHGIITAKEKDIIQFKVTQYPLSIDFSKSISFPKKERYSNTNDVSKRTGVPFRLLLLLTGNIILFINGKRKDIGLQFKTKNNERVIGYAQSKYTTSISDETYFLNDEKRKSKTIFAKPTQITWEFSSKAEKIIIEYAKKFGDVLEKLDSLLNQQLRIEYETLGLDIQIIYSIIEWVDSLEYRKQPLVNIDTEILPNDLIIEIEGIILQSQQKEKKEKIISLHKNLLYQPTDPFPYNGSRDDFSLGDRVTNISGTGAVPFGLSGTIISLTLKMAEIIFDEEFMGGSLLDGKLHSNRGGFVPIKHLINLSNPKYKKNFKKD